MKTINKLQMIGISSMLVLFSGCGDQSMPEVNEINCQHENIKKIKNKTIQQKFASKCLRRGGFKPSPKCSWSISGKTCES